MAIALATVSGQVRDAANGQPVRRAIVTITGAGLLNGRSAVTDDDGRFVIGDVPDGDFVVEASRPGFLKAAYGASRSGRPGTPIAVRGGANVTDLTITMTHGSAIAGLVRDAGGDPAPGLRVEAIRIQHLSTGDRAEKLGTAIADDRGEFRVFGLPAGDYILAVTPAVIVGGLGGVGAPSEAEVDAKLQALRARSSAPQPGASSSAPPLPTSTAFANPATFYPGVVNPAEAVMITVGANESREGIDFGTRLSHAATVDGTVVSASGAVPQIQIGIHGNGPQLPVAGGSAGGPSVRMDNQTHAFRITNVPSGHYRLDARTLNVPGNAPQIMASGGALPKQDLSGPVLWGAVEFDVSGSDVSGITLTLVTAPAVSGRLVIDRAAVKPPASLAGARVSLVPVPSADPRSNGLESPITTITTADGAFRLPTVVPGSYRVSTVLPSGWWLREAISGGVDVLDGTLTVGADGVPDLSLNMSDRHSSVGGTLTTAGGPATEYFLVAFTSDRALWRAPSRRVRSTRPATSGAFDVSDLPPGEYFLAALRDLDIADLEDPAFLESLIPAAASITILEGQRTVQDLRIGG